MSVDAVVFGPHPDDVELCCGGWIARTEARVAIVDLTAGELATNGTPAVRADEARAAAAILGAERHNLGLPDGHLAVTDPQVDAVVAILRQLRPRLVIAPWIEARHPDHAAAGQLVRRAHFLGGLVRHRPDLGPPHRAPRLLHYPMRQDVRADLVVDITEVVQVKQRAIDAHASQVGPGTATLVNRPVGLGAWEVRDRYWGATIGVAHGEPYLLGGPVPVGDLVAHFDAHPAIPALSPPR